VIAIPGAKKAHQAEESAGALQFKLSKDEMEQLDELSQDFNWGKLQLESSPQINDTYCPRTKAIV
jgi:diketogulonate reductase-like aldo/keto reductase